MPECRQKVGTASVFLTVFNSVNPASAFRHLGQSGAAVHGLVCHCPALQHQKERQKMHNKKDQ
jgi:hypothetical protein